MKNNLLYVLLAFLFVWCLILTFSLVNLGGKQADSAVINNYEVSGFSTDLSEVVEGVQAGLVNIYVKDGLIPGFVYRNVGPDTNIVTTYSLLNNAKEYSVRQNADLLEKAVLVGGDNDSDVAVLKITSEYRIDPMKRGDSKLLNAGEFLIAAYAKGYELLMNGSKEQFVSRLAGGHTYYLAAFAVDAIRQGSIAINMNGEVVGLGLKDGYLLGINEIAYVADALIESGEVHSYQPGVRGSYVNAMTNYQKAALGLNLDLFTGLYIDTVRPGSFFASVGVESRDVVLKVEDHQILDSADLLYSRYALGLISEITVLRNGEMLVLRVEDHD